MPSLPKPLAVPTVQWAAVKWQGGRTIKAVRRLAPKDLNAFYTSLPDIAVHGGRRAAEARLKALPLLLARYAVDRDIPAKAATSQLSAYLRFGVVSPREVVHAVLQATRGDVQHGMIRELIWRSFYYHHMWHQPALLHRAYNAAFEGFPSKRDSPHFRAFQQARTGFPLIDAGVRQLLQTGWCHNRVRMMLATFVVRGLGIYWKVGERWMATHLVDYDVVSNAMGWQWGLAAAPSSQPYFRTMSPWAQTERFDKDAAYVKQWLPELRSLASKDIRGWHKRSDPVVGVDYPLPLYDWATRVKEAHAAYKTMGERSPLMA